MQSYDRSNNQSAGTANGDSGGNLHAAAANPASGSIRDGNRHLNPHTRFQFNRFAD